MCRCRRCILDELCFFVWSAGPAVFSMTCRLVLFLGAFAGVRNEFAAKDMTAISLARSLRAKYPDTFAELDRLTKEAKLSQAEGSRKGCMLKGEMPKESLTCSICSVAKHHCEWMYRSGYKGARRCNGSICNTCFKTARYLGVSRSPNLIIQCRARDVFVTLSTFVRQSKGGEDVCRCHRCRPDEKDE